MQLELVRKKKRPRIVKNIQGVNYEKIKIKTAK